MVEVEVRTADRPILVVEDDDDTVAALRLLLADEGYASDTQRALDSLARHDPGLVLLDWSLDDGSGEAVLFAARRSDAARTPVVLMTGNSTVTSRSSKSADAILRKPFDISELLTIVARYYRP
jgi:DNA-binding response OmpR family regulator